VVTWKNLSIHLPSRFTSVSLTKARKQSHGGLADDGLSVFELGKRGDLDVDRLRPVIIGANGDMVGRHQRLDGRDIPLGERLLEGVGGSVDGGDRLGIASSGLKQGRSEDEEEVKTAAGLSILRLPSASGLDVLPIMPRYAVSSTPLSGSITTASNS
jgi:hypothetical protein